MPGESRPSDAFGGGLLRAVDCLRASGACLPVGLGGCVPEGAPAIPLLGAYFPSWLIAAAAGVGAALVARVVFVLVGLDDVLPFRLVVYVSLAVAVGFLVSAAVFGR